MRYLKVSISIVIGVVIMGGLFNGIGWLLEQPVTWKTYPETFIELWGHMRARIDYFLIPILLIILLIMQGIVVGIVYTILFNSTKK